MPSIVTAALIEALLELFLYGVYAVLFTTVVYLFRGRRGSSPEKRPVRWVLLGLIAQFLIITAHWVNTTYQTLFAIILFRSRYTVVNRAYHPPCDMYSPHRIAGGSGDIHRLHVTYSYRRKVILLPLILLVGHLVCGGGLIYHSIKWDPRSFAARYSLTNLSHENMADKQITGKAVGAYWRGPATNDALVHVFEPALAYVPQSLLAIFVESAALQMATSIGILITFQVGFVGSIVWAGIAATVFGISTVLYTRGLV
ncbi:hypothetical protein FB451DRAFT_312268 [Mycena latifolia]|nr:hypothetical protein FB451DRAFT_312268 [Mycena latifolia]